MKYDIDIYCFKFNPTRFDDDDDLTKGKEDLKLFPMSIPFIINHYGTVIFELNCYSKEDFIFPTLDDKCNDFRIDFHFYLKYSLSIENDLNEQDYSNLLWLLSKKISEFSVALQISIPDFVSFSEAFIFSNGKFKFKRDYLGFSVDILRIVDNFSWPKLQSLNPLMTWKWLEKYFIEEEKLSSNRTQRAIYAFTNLFANHINEDSYIDLIWSMIALESLYAKSKNGIQEQLNEKIKVILGELKDFKKIIKQMYDFRSQFLHGSLEIPSKFNCNDNSNERLDFMFKYWDTTSISIAILIGTFQYMVMNNLDELDFKYTLKN